MSDTYDSATATVDEKTAAVYARTVSVKLLEYFESVREDGLDRSLVDVCCGPGHLARHFLGRGYAVYGVDIADEMLKLAAERCEEFVADGRAAFMQADAACFALPRAVSFATSTFASLNLLPSFEAVSTCFRCVRACLAPGGSFAFDLETAHGLRHWQTVDSRTEGAGYWLRVEGSAPSPSTAAVRVYGELAGSNGDPIAFERTTRYRLHDLSAVREALLSAGWTRAWTARAADLARPAEPTADEERIFFVAR